VPDRAVPPSNDFIMRNSATAQQIEVGWWPGDHRYPHAAFFAFAFPAQRAIHMMTTDIHQRLTNAGAVGPETNPSPGCIEPSSADAES